MTTSPATSRFLRQYLLVIPTSTNGKHFGTPYFHTICTMGDFRVSSTYGAAETVPGLSDFMLQLFIRLICVLP